MTNLPVDAERETVRLLPVPDPTRSVVVFPGDRATVALLTNRPDLADLCTDFDMATALDRRETIEVVPQIVIRLGRKVRAVCALPYNNLNSSALKRDIISMDVRANVRDDVALRPRRP